MNYFRPLFHTKTLYSAAADDDKHPKSDVKKNGRQCIGSQLEMLSFSSSIQCLSKIILIKCGGKSGSGCGLDESSQWCPHPIVLY